MQRLGAGITRRGPHLRAEQGPPFQGSGSVLYWPFRRSQLYNIVTRLTESALGGL